MTATTTPRLGLMSPVDSDLFLSADFAATFALLDAKPGITFVNSYSGLAALAASWGIPQHGNMVLSRDNGALWYWYNPSASGIWKRANSVGVLNKTNQSSPVTTALQGTPGALFIDSGTVTFPGVRAIDLTLEMGLDNNSGTSGIVIVTIKDNGTTVVEQNYRAGSYINTNGASNFLKYTFQSPANNSSHDITAYIRSATLSAGTGGQGTSAARTSTLTLTEV